MTTLRITTNCDVLPAALESDIPDGVRVISGPIMRQRGFDVHVNLDFSIVIDVAKVAPFVVAAWFLRHVKQFKRTPTVYLDGKELPQLEDEATKMIQDAVEQKKEAGE